MPFRPINIVPWFLPVVLSFSCPWPDQNGLSLCCQTANVTGAFPELPAITYRTVTLDMSSCKLNFIKDGAFIYASQIRTLNISNGRFSKITRHTFKGLSNLKILIIENGLLNFIEKGTFEELFSLTDLSLKGNGYLALKYIPSVLHNLNQTRIRNLRLDHLNDYHASHERELKFEYIVSLQWLNLDMLSLADNQIWIASPKTLRVLIDIPCLYIQHNFIYRGYQIVGGNTNVPFYNLLITKGSQSNLRVLDVSGKSDYFSSNGVTYGRCHEPFHEPPACPRFDVKSATLHSGENILMLSSPPHLQIVDVSNAINRADWGKPWRNIRIGFDSKITKLFLGGTKLLRIRGPIYGLTCLTQLSFAGSRLDLEYPEAPYALAYLPNLSLLNLSDCSIRDEIDNKDRSLIRNMPNVRTIDLGSNGISKIALTHLVEHAPLLEYLQLSNNKLTSVPTIKASRKLRLLDLSGNLLTILTHNDRKRLEQLWRHSTDALVLLKRNPFQCQCSSETFSFLRWVKDNRGQIKDYESINCSIALGNVHKSKAISCIHVAQFQFHCFQDIVIGILCTVGGFMLVLVPGYVSYKNRWFIKYKLYKLRQFLKSELFTRRLTDLPLMDNDGANDENPRVYITSVSDRGTDEHEFVQGYLTDLLQEYGYNPLYHNIPDRDTGCFMGNQPYYVDIFQATEQSHRGILVLSNSLFESDHQTRGNVSFAVDQAFSRDVDFLTVVIYHQPPLLQWMGAEFTAVRSICTPSRSLEWSDNPNGQQLFEENLRDRLRSA